MELDEKKLDVAVAELVGWEILRPHIDEENGVLEPYWCHKDEDLGGQLPGFGSDLNAIQKAVGHWRAKSRDVYLTYCHYLREEMAEFNSRPGAEAHHRPFEYDADADVRCRALLRAIKLHHPKPVPQRHD